MSARYVIGVYDRAGEFASYEEDTLPAARATQQYQRARYPQKVVEIHDNERDGRVVDPDEEDPHGT